MDKLVIGKMSENRERIAQPLQKSLEMFDEHLRDREKTLGGRYIIQPWQAITQKKNIQSEDIVKIGSLQSEATLYHLEGGNLVFKTGSYSNRAAYPHIDNQLERNQVSALSHGAENREHMILQPYHLHNHPNGTIKNGRHGMSQADIQSLLKGRAEIELIPCTDGILIARRPRTALGRLILQIRFRHLYLDPKDGPYDPEWAHYIYDQQNKLGQVVAIVGFEDEKFKKIVMPFIRGEVSTRRFLSNLRRR